jgi:mono/diheme cytochrome c family protein
MRAYVIPLSIIAILLALLPFLLIAKTRLTRSDLPRVHLIPDMDNQPRYNTQARNTQFIDQRAMRPAVEGAVAANEFFDDLFITGKITDVVDENNPDAQWTTAYPDAVEITQNFMLRGEKQYQVFCSSCHGLSGDGAGMIGQRAELLQEGTWTSPPSYHTDTLRDTPLGSIYNTINNGIRNMPAHGPQIKPADRWAIVAYVKALQKSQNAAFNEVPADQQSNMR